MKGWLLGVLIILPCLALAGPSIAQLGIPEDNGLNYSLTLGAAMPVSGSTNQEVSPIVGITWYDQAGEQFGRGNGAIGITAEWTLIRRKGDDKDVNFVPIMVSFKQYGTVGGWRLFTSLGVGILATTDSIPEMQIDDGANFGWTGGFGVDLTNNLYFQFKFIGGSNPSDDGLWSVGAGYRF
ncbi:MAG: hypothetical protein M1133_03080 [Armatimonadetes bacterium]|nr:hypothetical protein [Armatimonadota bacterium]